MTDIIKFYLFEMKMTVLLSVCHSEIIKYCEMSQIILQHFSRKKYFMHFPFEYGKCISKHICEQWNLYPICISAIVCLHNETFQLH